MENRETGSPFLFAELLPGGLNNHADVRQNAQVCDATEA